MIPYLLWQHYKGSVLIKMDIAETVLEKTSKTKVFKPRLKYTETLSSTEGSAENFCVRLQQNFETLSTLSRCLH